MSAFHLHEGLVDLPDDYQDRTMNMFSREIGPNQMVAIVITRDDFQGDLATFVTTAVKQLTKQLPRFVQIGRQARTFGAVAGEEVISQWRREGADIYQRQAFIPVREGRLLTATVSAPAAHRAVVDRDIKALLADFKLRRP